MAQLGNGYNFLEPFYQADGDAVRFTQPAARASFQKINPELGEYIRPADPRRFVFVFGLYPSFLFNTDHWSNHTIASWDDGRQFTSSGTFASIVEEVMKIPLQFFALLQSMNVRFSVASCCPVPASYHQLVPRSRFVGGEIPLIFNRTRDRVVQHLDRLGIQYHLPPEDVYDERGAMMDTFANKPGDYHANAEYGLKMMSKILTELEEVPSTPMLA